MVSSDVCRCAPVILFFHGGSWRWGQKDYHREIGKQFARKGIVFITAVTLYPGVRFPAFPEGVAPCLRLGEEKRSGAWRGRKQSFPYGPLGEQLTACLVGLDPVYLKAHGGELEMDKGVVSMSAP